MPGQRVRRWRLFSYLLLLGALLLLSLAACGTDGSNSGGTGSSTTLSGNIATPTSGASSATTPSVTTTATNFNVTSIDMAVSPTSLNSYACGTSATITYTATFNFPANNPGGQVTFTYTTDNGRDNSSAQTLNVSPGQGNVTYQFTWSGTLPQDHTMPEPGGVMVSQPNTINSPLLGPTGSCSGSSTTPTPTVTTTPFQVVSATVAASPSLNGQACGTQFTEQYTVTFTTTGSTGGKISFTYSTDNGRSNSSTKHVTVPPGSTTATYTFTWTGKLLADHTQPGTGAVAVTAPNAITSTGGVPDGQCSGS